MITNPIEKAVEDLAMTLNGRTVKRQVELYAEILSQYRPQGKVLQAIDQLMRTESKLPPPHVICRAVEGMGAHRPITYNKIEDWRFPANKLWRAYEILSNGNRAAAVNYMDSVGMPENDRQRVFDKHRFHTDPKYREWVKEQAAETRQLMKGFGSIKTDNDVPF